MSPSHGRRSAFAGERFVFCLSYRGRARTDPRSPAAEERLALLKREMAGRVMAAPASAVYDVG